MVPDFKAANARELIAWSRGMVIILMPVTTVGYHARDTADHAVTTTLVLLAITTPAPPYCRQSRRGAIQQHTDLTTLRHPAPRSMVGGK